MTAKSETLEDLEFWGALDNLQRRLGMLQAADSYHDLLHEIPLPIWIEDWSVVKERLESLELPEAGEVGTWLNAQRNPLLELYHLMPVINTNAVAF